MNSEVSIQIETQRLILRPPKQEDFLALCVLDMDPEVRSFFPEGPLTSEQVQIELDRFILEWREWGYGIFSVIDKTNNHLIGRCGFAKLKSGVVEMGYLFLKEHWGKGLATEVTIAMLAWAKTHVPIEKITAFAPISHPASLRVLQKARMNFVRKDFYQGIECDFYESTNK